MKCPVCLDVDIEYVEKRPKCPVCDWPMRYQEYYEKNDPHKLDLFYRLFKFFADNAGLTIEGEQYMGGVRIIMDNIHEFIMNWILSVDDLAGMIYIVTNQSLDVYEFRGVYTNPYAAARACEIIEYENENRGLKKARPQVEMRLLNHLYGSSMFAKLYEKEEEE